MPWLWPSFEAYSAAVNPELVKRGRFRVSEHETLFAQISQLVIHRDRLESANGVLSSLLTDLRVQGAHLDLPNKDQVVRLHFVVTDAVEAGEEILLRHRRLVHANFAYGFLHQHSVLSEWDRYASTPRLVHELERLVEDIRELLDGYRQLEEADRDMFPIRGADLPHAVTAEFEMARDLFSVGQDQSALFLIGRGLEGLLQEVARKKGLEIVTKGRKSPAFDTDLNDLIELLFRVRWAASEERLVPEDVKAFMHYLRVLRNAGAHARKDRRPYGNAREAAAIALTVAQDLWGKCSIPRLRVMEKCIERTW